MGDLSGWLNKVVRVKANGKTGVVKDVFPVDEHAASEVEAELCPTDEIEVILWCGWRKGKHRPGRTKWCEYTEWFKPEELEIVGEIDPDPDANLMTPET